MSPQLTVRNAQVSTATVEIKTLTVSGKQVTLAVFRQLIEAPLIAEDGSLNGDAWGTVNYHPGKCGDDAPHWHVVWQLGDELRRSQVSMTYQPEPVFWSKALTHLHAASVHHWLVTGEVRYFQGRIFNLFQLDQAWNRQRWVDDYRQAAFTDEETGIKTGYHVPEEVKAAMLAKSDLASVYEIWEAKKQHAAEAEQDLEIAREDLSAASRRGFRRPKAPENHSQNCTCTECLRSDPLKAADRVQRVEERLEKAREQVKEYSPDLAKEQQAQAALSAALTALHDRYATKSLDALWTAYRRELKAEAARRKRHVKVRKDIANLPQLFIAV
jgi:hypothetical protein